jgi:Ca2+-binding RTX toxin-like protein
LGDDQADGGNGNDKILGGEGNDHLVGGNGDDEILGGKGQDRMEGGAGDDTLNGIVDGKTDGRLGKVDSDRSDILLGGAGADTLFLGQHDFGTGGAGADTFVLGSWIQDDNESDIQDFDPDEDEIVLIYDPEDDPDPVVETEPAGDNTKVFFNGAHVSTVKGVDLNGSTIKLLERELV